MPRKTPAVSLVVSPDIRKRLDAAADKNHRSLTQEVAARIAQSFEGNDEMFGAIMKIIGVIEDRTGKAWTEDAWATKQVAIAAHNLAIINGVSADKATPPKFVKPIPKGINPEKFGEELVMYLQLFGDVP